MKSKKLFLPALIIGVGILVTILEACFLGIVKKPAITEAEFPFTITYEYKGETKTIEDSYICHYDSGNVIGGEQIMYWNGGIASLGNMDGTNVYVLSESEEGDFLLMTNIFAGYLMGDSSWKTYYEEELPYQPYGAFYDQEGLEHTDKETLEANEFEIISWEYPEPIETEYVFSHIQHLNGDTCFSMAATALVILVICILLVKKEENLVYTKKDKMCRICNVVNSIVLIPFITITCCLMDINGGGEGLSYQIGYCIPAISIFCLAASVCLRRKGYSKESMLVQFAGPVLFAIVILFC